MAFFWGPTTTYAHGVLGDAIEARNFLITVPGYPQFCDSVAAGAGRVFEDTAPRLIDLNGDGKNEVIVVASSFKLGARLEIYGYPSQGQDIRLLAHTPYIGRSHRWLAPVGAADLDGDGSVEIAYIDRPHLTKTLRIWRFDNGVLDHVADQRGLSNHRIGEPFITGGIRHCAGQPEIITASADWSRIMASTLRGGRVETRDIGPLTSGRVAAAMACGAG